MEIPKPGKSAEKKDQATTLEGIVQSISGEINDLMRKTFGVDGFVESNGRLDMQKYMERRSISRDSFLRDKKYIEERENSFRDKDNRENIGNQMELLAMALFHKFFSRDFLVVRTSTYDDYKNGVDMILVNRKTGAVICAFDDVVGHPASDHLERKKETIAQIVGRGGTTLKYGFQIKGSYKGPELDEKELENLPIFKLQVTPDEFRALYDSVSPNPKADPSGKEIELMKNILDSIMKQYQELDELRLIPQLRENLKQSMASINQMAESNNLKG